jgi:hypothetical protein
MIVFYRPPHRCKLPAKAPKPSIEGRASSRTRTSTIATKRPDRRLLYVSQKCVKRRIELIRVLTKHHMIGKLRKFPRVYGKRRGRSPAHRIGGDRASDGSGRRRSGPAGFSNETGRGPAWDHGERVGPSPVQTFT